MKMNCIIVDDEPLARRVLEEYIEEVDFLTLCGKAENPLKAGRLLLENDIDLLFLDINMPKMTGIEWLRISGQSIPCVITTAYAEYAIDGFELDALDYLVKPFSFDRFMISAQRARDQYTLRHRDTPVPVPEEDYFFVKCDGKIEKIMYDELVYVEAMLNYIILHTANRKFIVYLTMKGIQEQLPAARFLKIHKSFIINLSKIKSIDGNEINTGKATIPISQALYENVIKEILKGRMLKR